MSTKVKQPFSKHIFMFAFKWNYIDSRLKDKNKKYRKFSEKINLLKFDEMLKVDSNLYGKNKVREAKMNNQGKWVRYTYEDEHIKDYNEYSYYYHNVRDAIYTNDPSAGIKDKKVNIYHYCLSKEDMPCYIIEVLLCSKPEEKEKKNKVYKLDIIQIELKVYDTGVAVLSFFTENYTEPLIEDINSINNYGRRIYPQFIKPGEGKLPTQKTKEAFLANRHILQLSKEPDDCFVETYTSDYEIEGNRISHLIMALLGNSFKTGKDALRSHKEDTIIISPLIDDRMYVICWYENKEMADTLKEIRPSGNDIYYSYIQNDKWYEYIFMEQKKSCQSRWMLQEILKRHTYERWIEGGTLYGISYTSFVCLTDGNAFARDNISRHMTTIYYQMMCLVLAQKASILRFEDELTDISNHSKNIPVEAVEEVYQNYLQFINGIYFKEVTAEEQGMELYRMAQSLMRIDHDIKALKEEIGQLFRYVSLRSDKETNRAINALTYLNTLILVPALVTGFFGMNIFGDGLKEAWSITDYKKLIIWGCIFIIAVGIMPLAIIKNKMIQKFVKMIPEKWLTIVPWIIILIAGLTAAVLYFFN